MEMNQSIEDFLPLKMLAILGKLNPEMDVHNLQSPAAQPRPRDANFLQAIKNVRQKVAAFYLTLIRNHTLGCPKYLVFSTTDTIT